MKDYYKILGVKEEASGEEIRARWIELTKNYHPDLGKTEEGDEKIREINEAYEVLKDDLRRFDYDFERVLKRSFSKKAHRQQEKRTNIRKIILIPSLGILILFLIVGFILFRRPEVAIPPGTGAKTEALHKIDKVPEEKTALQTPPVKTDSTVQEETRVPKEIKKEVIPTESKEAVSLSPGVSPSAKILPESKVPARVQKEVPKAIRKELPAERTRIASTPVPPPTEKESEARKRAAPQVAMRSEIPAVKEVTKEVPKELPKQVMKEVPKEVPKEIPKEVAIEIPKESSKEVPKEALKEVPKEIPKEVAKEIPKESPKEAPKEVLKEVPKEIPKEAAKEVSKELRKEAPKDMIRVTLHPGETLTMWTKEEKKAPIGSPLLAKEEEVREFFSNYVDRYNRKDVSGFLSFFSSKVIQNQTDGLGVIRNLYTKLINQSEELRYQIEGMRIEIHQNNVDVKARFRLDQKLKKDGEEKVWKGNIRWVLVKEEGRLRIISLDYQNDKSP